MRLQESGEMYLETIYILSQQMNLVRSIDVVEHIDESIEALAGGAGSNRGTGGRHRMAR